jgi:diguanylate cyclase (GGDEF)-like protein
VVDLNPAAQAILACDRSQAIGRPAAELLPGWAESVDDVRDGPAAPNEVVLGEGADRRDFDLRVSPLSDTRGRPSGSLLILREITRLKQAELKLQEEKRKIETLHDIARLMGSSESEADVLDLTVYAAETVLGLAYCHIALLEEGRLVGKAFSTALTPEMTETIPIHEGPVATAFRKGKTYVIPDFSEDPDTTSIATHFRSGIFLPLNGLGVALVLSPKPAAYTQDDARLMELLLGHTVEALKRIRLQESFRQQVIHDPLTGVYNRRHFTATLATELLRAKRYGHPIGFLMLDINDFKHINDRFGHQVGDQVLQGVARLLLEQVREMDVVVRYGGDEFLVVLPETNGETDSVADRIRRAVARWNQEGRLLQGFSVTLAIGTSHWNPTGTETLETILGDADQRMYRDKESRDRGVFDLPAPDTPVSG